MYTSIFPLSRIVWQLRCWRCTLFSDLLTNPPDIQETRNRVPIASCKCPYNVLAATFSHWSCNPPAFTEWWSAPWQDDGVDKSSHDLLPASLVYDSKSFSQASKNSTILDVDQRTSRKCPPVACPDFQTCQASNFWVWRKSRRQPNTQTPTRPTASNLKSRAISPNAIAFACQACHRGSPPPQKNCANPTEVKTKCWRFRISIATGCLLYLLLTLIRLCRWDCAFFQQFSGYIQQSESFEEKKAHPSSPGAELLSTQHPYTHGQK